MTTVKYNVPNISCGHCVHTIQMEVGDLDGVSSVQASSQKSSKGLLATGKRAHGTSPKESAQGQAVEVLRTAIIESRNHPRLLEPLQRIVDGFVDFEHLVGPGDFEHHPRFFLKTGDLHVAAPLADSL